MENKLKKAIDSIKSGWVPRFSSLFDQQSGNILDAYMMSSPSAQNALDIFKGEWASKLPDPDLEAGSALLFEDPRLTWFIDQAGGVNDKSVLELGPLEAGHTYIMEREGAKSILSIEANTRAYLKCLVIKEIYQLQKVRFLCGDFMEYLRHTRDRFEIGLASGVLYHMANPVELIARLAETTRHLYLWTHYCDPGKTIYTRAIESEYEGFIHTLYRKPYKRALKNNQFCGGGQPFSHWLNQADLMGALEHFGFKIIATSFDTPAHPNGPAIAIYAALPAA